MCLCKSVRFYLIDLFCLAFFGIKLFRLILYLLHLICLIFSFHCKLDRNFDDPRVKILGTMILFNKLSIGLLMLRKAIIVAIVLSGDTNLLIIYSLFKLNFSINWTLLYFCLYLHLVCLFLDCHLDRNFHYLFFEQLARLNLTNKSFF